MISQPHLSHPAYYHYIKESLKLANASPSLVGSSKEGAGYQKVIRGSTQKSRPGTVAYVPDIVTANVRTHGDPTATWC